MALTGNVKMSFAFSKTATADYEAATSLIADSLAIAFTDGVAAGNADLIWKDERTLVASATETLDFKGALTDIYGAVVSFADIRAIIVTATAANTNNVNVTRATTSPETSLPLFLASGDGIAVRPGGMFLWACPDATGIPLVAGTADKLTFTNSAGSTSVTYRITVIGASA